MEFCFRRLLAGPESDVLDQPSEFGYPGGMGNPIRPRGHARQSPEGAGKTGALFLSPLRSDPIRTERRNHKKGCAGPPGCGGRIPGGLGSVGRAVRWQRPGRPHCRGGGSEGGGPDLAQQDPKQKRDGRLRVTPTRTEARGGTVWAGGNGNPRPFQSSSRLNEQPCGASPLGRNDSVVRMVLARGPALIRRPFFFPCARTLSYRRGKP